MNLIILKEFFASYSLPSVIMAVIISIIVSVAERLIKGKKIKSVLSILPFILGILFNLVYNLILTSRFIFDLQTVSAGFMSGWLSLAIKVIIDLVKKGEKLPDTKEALVITGLIEGYVPDEIISTVSKGIEDILTNHVEDDDTIGKIAHHLLQNAKDGFFFSDMLALAGLIFASIKQIKE